MNSNSIEFISHDTFPQDEYTKELVYLCLNQKYRVAYVRKTAKNGGLFWSVASIGATKNGQKEYFPAFLQDSNFLEKDIKDFLERRKWENSSLSALPKRDLPYGGQNGQNFQNHQKAISVDQIQNEDDLPF